MTHADLVVRAEKWLKSRGCGVVFRDEFRALTHSGEQPDAIGWRDGLSILIECKASRSDFLADKRKRFRQDPVIGMGDWRFFMTPAGVVSPDDIPEGWGLLHATTKQIKRVHNVPTNGQWWTKKPFEGNKRSETQMMYSALRRMIVRGHFDSIYETLITAGSDIHSTDGYNADQQV